MPKYDKNKIFFKSIKCKNTGVEKFRQPNKHHRERDYYNSISTVDCTNEISGSSYSSSHHYKHLHDKLRKQQHVNVKKQKRETALVGRATVPITPQMIRGAIKELQTRRAHISSSLIAKHLRRSYPIENDTNKLKGELNEKLNCAVSVGLIAKCGDDKYCIPTLRQQANFNKTAVTAFWDTYYGSSVPSTTGQFITLGMLKEKADRKKVVDITLNYCSDSSMRNRF